MKKCLHVIIASIVGWAGFSFTPIDCQTFEVRSPERSEEIGKDSEHEVAPPPERGGELPPIEERQPEAPVIPVEPQIGPEFGERSPEVPIIQPNEPVVITPVVVEPEVAVSDKMIAAWDSQTLKNEIPALRFSQSLQRVDFLSTLDALRAGTPGDFEDPQVQKELNDKYDTIKKVDAVLKKMSDDALAYAQKLTVSSSLENVLTTSITIAALAGMRRNLAVEQAKLFDYLKVVEKIKSNRLRPLLDSFDVTPEDFSRESSLTQAVAKLTNVNDQILKIDPRLMAQTGGISVILPERDALSSFIIELQALKTAVEASSEDYQGDHDKLADAQRTLDDLISNAQLARKKITTQWNLAQSKNFTIRVNDFFANIKRFLQYLSAKITVVSGTLGGVAGGERPDADAWKAIAEVIASPANQDQIQEAYNQFDARLNELENFISAASSLVQEVRSGVSLDADQKQVLLALRQAFEAYLTTLSSSGQMLGVRVDNPTALGSRLLHFISAWYRPAGESVLQDDLTLVTNASGPLGDAAQLIKRLDGQATDAARLLRIIDVEILKQANIAAQSLYAFSFLGTILANAGASLSWAQSATIGVLDTLGKAIGVQYQRILLPIPAVTMAAAVLFEALAYAAQKGALKLAGV